MKPEPCLPASGKEAVAWCQERIRTRKPFRIAGNHCHISQSPAVGEISTVRMDGLKFLEPENMVAGAESGMLMSHFQELLNQQGMFLPVSHWHKNSTIGGVIACNDSGPERMMGGGLRDYLIGIEYCNGEGALVRGGGRVVKNVSGYDIQKMMLGSRGGLGLITSANFKVLPLPESARAVYMLCDHTGWKLWAGKCHRKFVCWDWLQVIWTGKMWIAGAGFSGNLLRTERIRSDLNRELPADCQLLEELPDGLPEPGQGRFQGYVSEILNRQEKPYDDRMFHCSLHMSTAAFLERFQPEKLAFKHVILVCHPVGADVHIFCPWASEESLSGLVGEIKTQQSGTGGFLQIHTAEPFKNLVPECRVPENSRPPGYHLMQRLKAGLDRHRVFSSGFYG